MLEMLILLIIFSIDTLLVCSTYAIRKIKIPLKSILIISFICSISLFISLNISKCLNHIINKNISNIITFIILIMLGLYNIYGDKIKYKLSKKNKNKLIDIFIDETKADLNNSKNLDYKEAIILSVILSFDSLLGGISIGFIKYNIFFVLSLSFLINIIFIILGNILGSKIDKYINFNTSYISGIILIMLGILKLL